MTSGRDVSRTPGNAFARWMDILRQMKELYGQLTEAERVKREAVRFGEAADIEAATDRQKRLLDRFDELDAERRNAMTEWQRARGLKPDARSTLSDVIAVLDEEERNAVRELQRQLTEAARRLRTAAEANRDLLQAELDSVTAQTATDSGTRSDYIYGKDLDERPEKFRSSGYDIRM